MSLPTAKPAQLSIRSFFTSKAPKYAPPPSSTPANRPTLTEPASAPPPPTTPPAPLIQDRKPQEAEAEQNSTTSTKEGSAPPQPASLPREATIRPITGDDLNALRRINALLLPVNYPDNFYKRAVEGPFSRVITWAHDGAEPKVVGGVVCRVEPDLINGTPSTEGTVPESLYIQSLCLLSPYRGMGLINAAVESIIATAIADPSLNVANVTAHVWTENEDGLKWYQGRGFQRVDAPIRGYYLKLRPDSAWLVRRPVRASVRSFIPSTSANGLPSTSRSVPPGISASIVNLPPMSGPPRGPNAPPLPRGQSYQNQRAETEWNDLPEDMATGRLRPPTSTNSGSTASSRSSSTARKKRDRSYPTAAFGN
ncbi:hypothetical protein BGZ63DRAFT_421604 [Mariannaea sp. PMI_226]|nr:hypothetical protein BGZ63DRAFT_421604 [Mariannaea sp. PMI_226]